MSGTAIPASARVLVKRRAHGRCERCGVPAPDGQWHHRRSRRVVAPHRHCPCNGVWLCLTCHHQVHVTEQAQARTEGFVLSQWIDEPFGTRVRTPWGERYHDCEGTYRFPLITETGATDERANGS